MDRLFACLLALALLLAPLCALHACAPKPAQPAFFSMLFPQFFPVIGEEERAAEDASSGKTEGGWLMWL